MAYTTGSYQYSTNFAKSPYLSCVVFVDAYRDSYSDKSVKVEASLYLGFGTSADSSSYSGSGEYITMQLTGGVTSSAVTVKPSSEVWTCNGESVKLVSTVNVYGKGPTRPNKKVSGTLSNWTSGEKTFTVTIYSSGYGNSTFSVTLAPPTYYTNAKVSMTTKSTTVNPGTDLTIKWSGTDGTNNKITKYVLYYNGSKVYSGTGTSYTVDAPPATKKYEAYVQATAAHNSPKSSTITITTNDYGTPTAMITSGNKTVKPETKITISWAGSNGTSNPISKFQLYYNDTKVYEGTASSYSVSAPPVGSTYKAYVKAVGKYGSKVGTSSSVSIKSEAYAWVAVNGVWKSVQAIYVGVNGEWKMMDPDSPISVGVNESWKGV